MTTEQLQDALTLLPDELVLATDRLRTAGRPKVILWKRLVPIAACLVLLLSVSMVLYGLSALGGGKTADTMAEAPAAAAPPMMQESAAQDMEPAQAVPNENGTRTEEETIMAAGDYPAMIMVEGKLYYYQTEAISMEVEESAILGYTTSYTDQVPQKDGETNFSRELGMPYAKVAEGIAVLYEDEWHLCTEEK